MAILRNREVIYLGPATAADTSPTVRVQDSKGNIEFCKLSELRFTEDEKEDLLKTEKNRIDSLAVISDKEFKELRDSQDPEVAKEFAVNKDAVEAQDRGFRLPNAQTVKEDKAAEVRAKANKR